MHGKLHLPGLSLHLMSAGEPAEMARAELMSTPPSPDELLAFLGRVQSFPENPPATGQSAAAPDSAGAAPVAPGLGARAAEQDADRRLNSWTRFGTQGRIDGTR